MVILRHRKNVLIRQASGKTKASSRTLPLVGMFREYFATVKMAQEENKRICGNCYNYDYDGYIFVDEMRFLCFGNVLHIIEQALP